MERERAFVNLLALCFIRWKVLVIGAVIGAITLGTWQYYSQMHYTVDEEAIELATEEYEKELAEYNEAVSNSNVRIRAYESSIAENQKYVEESLLMLINPYNTFTNVVDLSIVLGVGEEADSDDDRADEYYVNRIQEQYMTIFRNINVSKIDQLSAIHPQTDEKYWDEVLSVETVSGGLIEIKAMGATADETIAMTQAIVDCLDGLTAAIAEGTYAHSLVRVSEITSVCLDADVWQKQYLANAAISSGQSDLAFEQEWQASLVEPVEPVFSVPSMSKKTIALFGLVGLVVGLVIAMIMVMMYAVLTDLVITEEEVVVNCGITFLGSLYTDRWICRIEKMCGGHVWKDEDSSVEYMRESIKSLIKADKVLVLSSLELAEDDPRIHRVLEHFRARGIDASFLENAAENEKLYEALAGCSGVVMAEEVCLSKMNKIDRIVRICDEVEVDRIGFFLMNQEL